MKLKSNVKKKLLTALLIGASISGISGKASFASSNDKVTDLSRSEFVSVSSPEVKKIIDDMNTKRWTVVVYPIKGTQFTFLLWGEKLYIYDSSNGGGFRKGLVIENGHRFFFNERHFYAEKGWYNVKYYGRLFFDRATYEGKRNCFCTIDGETFHFNDKATVDIGLMEIDGKTYRFRNKTGAEAIGWWSEGPYRYFFEPNGAAHVGWYKDGQAGDMYFDEKGRMVEGLRNIGCDTYYFEHHGRGANTYTASGFYSSEKTHCRYYFDPEHGNKAIKDGWLQTGAGFYVGTGVMHFDASGNMSDGVTEIDGNLYLFTHPNHFSVKLNSYLTTGWYTDMYTHRTYYFNPNTGQAARSVSNTPVGAAVKGVQYIDGQRYVFDQEGVLIG